MLVASWTIVADAEAAGPRAVFTTDPTGQALNQNRYERKRDVYLNGGPDGAPNGLADGDYAFQVTDPSAHTLLSEDPARCRIVRIEQGRIVALTDLASGQLVDHSSDDDCHTEDPEEGAGPSTHHDTNSDGDGLLVQLMPFADTPSTAGVYKLWFLPVESYLDSGGDLEAQPATSGFAPDPGFGDPRDAKSDNFKVRADADNLAPIADAGDGQRVAVGTAATLDGTRSFDPDGDPLTYGWSLLEQPLGSAAALSDPAAVRPSLFIDQPGRYLVELVVDDGLASSAPDTVAVHTENSAPTADAGADQTTPLEAPVILDGSGSSDPDGDALSFAWTLIEQPPTSAATLDDPTAVMPAFVADEPGTYRARLVVDDGQESSAPDEVTIDTVNSAPVANAGPDQTVPLGADVTLDAGASTDVDGDLLSYLWTLLSAPEGSGASLSDQGSLSPTFVADVPGDYVLQLVVGDGTTESEPDTVTISTANSAPVADAGENQTVAVGELVTLDGSSSGDVDGDELQYTWSLITVPTGSLAVLSVQDDPRPTFVADVEGLYVAQLIVSDGSLTSAAVTVTISAGNTPPVADAGPDQTFLISPFIRHVQLDGSGSFDVDGDPLTFSWSVLSTPPGGSAVFGDATLVAPLLFVGEERGTYVVQLIVNDGQQDSEPDTVVLETENSPPVASAGPDRTAFVGEIVPLDGSGSSDVDGDPLTFSWSFLSRPQGSVATLSDPTSVMPTFVMDVAGTFVVQLIVNDDEADSFPDSVAIATVNAPPIADAGPDQSPLVGDLAVLDGSASRDPEGDPLTFSWSLLSKPAGSAATLDDPSLAMPSFSIDAPGTYLAQLVVNDGEVDSAPDTVTLSTSGSRPVAAAGADQTVPAGTTVVLDGTGSDDADADPLSFSWSILSAPDGSTATLDDPNAEQPAFVPDLPGLYLIQLIVNDGGADSEPDAIVVEALASNQLSLVLEGPLVGIDRSVSGTVFLGSPAPPGGTVVTLASDDPTIATLHPLEVTIPEGELSAPLTVEGLALGTTTLRASASDFDPTATPVTVTDFLISIDNLLVVAPGETQGLAVSLSRPAPAGGTTIFFHSADAQIATISESVFVPAGQQLPVANPQVTGGLVGMTEVTATADGFAPDTRPITVTLSMTLSPDPLVLPFTERPIELRLSDPAPAGGLVVDLATDAAAIATVPPTATVLAGEITVTIPVTGVSFGNTTLRVSAPGVAEATAQLEVRDDIDVLLAFLGDDMQRDHFATLGAPAGPEGTTMTVTSSDSARLLVATSGSEVGTASVSLPIAGNGNGAGFWLQALDDNGQVEYTVSAPGYRDAVGTVWLRPSGFICDVPSPFSCDINTDTLTSVERGPIRVRSLSSSLAPLFDGGLGLRPGVTAEVEIVSSDPEVGGVADPLTFTSASPSNTTFVFEPAAPGETTLTLVPPPGFDMPSSGATVLATVVAPTLALPPETFLGSFRSQNVGRDLQRRQAIEFSPHPVDPIEVTVTIADPSVAVVAPDPSQLGSGSLTMTSDELIDPRGDVSIAVQGLELGSTSLTVSAPGYPSATLDFEVLPASAALPFGDFTAETLTPPGTRPYALLVEDPDKLERVQLRIQWPRPGAGLSLEISSSEPSVGLVSPGTLAPATPGSESFHLQPFYSYTFEAVGEGTTTITITLPDGFVDPTGDDASTAVTATVEAADIIVDFPQTGQIDAPLRVGRDLQALGTLRPERLADPIAVTATIGDPSIAVVAPGGTVEGSSTASFEFDRIGTQSSISVQGLTEGETTLTFEAPGYATRILDIVVLPPVMGLKLISGSLPPALTLTTFDPNLTLEVIAGPLDDFFNQQRPRPGLAPIPVEISSSNPAVASITTSPVSFTFPPFSITTEVDPTVAGSTTVELIPPAGFQPLMSGGVERTRFDLTVEAPDILVLGPSGDVGLNLQRRVDVRLEQAPPEPVDVTVSSTAPTLFTLSTDPTVPGVDSVTFSGVTGASNLSIWVQGLALGAGELLAQASGYDDGTSDVDVLPSGFVHADDDPIATSSGAANTVARVRSVVIDPTDLSPIGPQAIRAGLSVEVTVTSDQPGVAAVAGGPMTFAGGVLEGSIEIVPQAAGTAVLTVETPPGFFTPSERRTRIVEVSP